MADDHAILRDGIVSLLKQEPSLNVACTAAGGYEVLDLLAKQEVDVCLLDINMPGLDGIETAKVIRQRKPEIKIIMLTTYNDREIISELVHIGVAGYLLKNSNKEELVEAVHKVMKGRNYFSEEVEKVILEGLTEKKDTGVITLTEREVEVVQLLAKEYTNDKIAEELHISYRTVETHRKNIMQKTKALNLAGLIKYAYSKGLIK
ncbi:MAG: response regulator transcription factor [Sphingobacteriales bacterium]|nr:response regulator transcription factor [Sphingobacteriales bacterium]MBI3718678.1 response regulator transcription factor [Sphingobacteriales bacterium]